MKLTLNKSDSLGAFASSLCLVHCIATPLLFIVPLWWQWLDYFFLIISFFAVYRSTQTTSKKLIKPAFWISWTLLAFILINEKQKWLHLPELLSYAFAIVLIILHLYNLKYYQCKNDKCYMD